MNKKLAAAYLRHSQALLIWLPQAAGAAVTGQEPSSRKAASSFVPGYTHMRNKHISTPTSLAVKRQK